MQSSASFNLNGFGPVSLQVLFALLNEGEKLMEQGLVCGLLVLRVCVCLDSFLILRQHPILAAAQKRVIFLLQGDVLCIHLVQQRDPMMPLTAAALQAPPPVAGHTHFLIQWEGQVVFARAQKKSELLDFSLHLGQPALIDSQQRCLWLQFAELLRQNISVPLRGLSLSALCAQLGLQGLGRAQELPALILFLPLQRTAAAGNGVLMGKGPEINVAW